MSNLLEPQPPILTGQERPTETHGKWFSEPGEVQSARRSFERTLHRAEGRISDIFHELPRTPRERVEFLEHQIEQMWEQGWHPAAGDVALFILDIGVVLANAVREIYDGTFYIRSTDDLLHTSLFWDDRAVEIFPFHKTYNRLLHEDGDSLLYFVESIADVVE